MSIKIRRYKRKVNDSGDLYWFKQTDINLPIESYKYATTKWNENYTWSRLAYLIYGDSNAYWVILKANNLTNPHAVKVGQKIRFLLPKYINEIEVL